MVALVGQMWRASFLDINLYEEVERDTSQTRSALTVAAIASSVVGLSVLATMTLNGSASMAPPVLIAAFVGGVAAAMVGLAVWTACVYWMGLLLFHATATWGEVVRTVGFAFAPGVLNVFGFIPVFGDIVSVVVPAWMVVASVIAVRQSLDVNTIQAIVTSLIGGVLAGVLVVLMSVSLALPLTIAVATVVNALIR